MKIRTSINAGTSQPVGQNSLTMCLDEVRRIQTQIDQLQQILANCRPGGTGGTGGGGSGGWWGSGGVGGWWGSGSGGTGSGGTGGTGGGFVGGVFYPDRSGIC